MSQPVPPSDPYAVGPYGGEPPVSAGAPAWGEVPPPLPPTLAYPAVPFEAAGPPPGMASPAGYLSPASGLPPVSGPPPVSGLPPVSGPPPVSGLSPVSGPAGRPPYPPYPPYPPGPSLPVPFVAPGQQSPAGPYGQPHAAPGPDGLPPRYGPGPYGQHPYGPPPMAQIVLPAPQKSVAVSLILTFLFGPLGMLYTTVTGALVMIGVNVLVGCLGAVTMGFGWLAFGLTWPVCMVWGAMAASSSRNQPVVGTIHRM